MLECVVAILIINLTIVGMFNLLKGQEQRVRGVEKWLEKTPVFFVNPDPEPLARILGKPASLDPFPQLNAEVSRTNPFQIRVIEVRRELAPASLAAVFEVYQTKFGSDDDSGAQEGHKISKNKGESNNSRKVRKAPQGNGWRSAKEFKTESTHFRIHETRKKRDGNKR
jgi:hypothetical protein